LALPHNASQISAVTKPKKSQSPPIWDLIHAWQLVQRVVKRATLTFSHGGTVQCAFVAQVGAKEWVQPFGLLHCSLKNAHLQRSLRMWPRHIPFRFEVQSGCCKVEGSGMACPDTQHPPEHPQPHGHMPLQRPQPTHLTATAEITQVRWAQEMLCTSGQS